MRKITEYKCEKPTAILDEQERSGEVICVCGTQFEYALRGDKNMANWQGFVVPVCPECGTIPQSDTRRMDL